MLKLFYSRGSVALASHIALEEAGAAYEAIRVDLPGGEQTRPDYLAINPKGRVPALATPRGVLTETPAILAFIAQSHPEGAFASLDDPFDFARAQAFNSYLASTVHVAHAHGRRGSRWADDAAAIAEMKRKVPQTMAACFAQIEADLPDDQPWVLGADYSIC
uniref:glutathione S-transferase n=1 Tax=Phenylobacterium sp. TaxID=1871053 RepID=UPI002FC71A20